ncbi:MAG: helix-turn-helix transcriptional regulator, partial [Deltaproteobacteria bacterium]|nr:helix-turn-helix transcriptional regulator [Deltaproteobacteria bacterium]
VDIAEVAEKQNLIELIIKARKAAKLSQQGLAKKIGVTQGRIAQIESGLGTANITFDLLLHLLSVLGYHFHIIAKKAA